MFNRSIKIIATVIGCLVLAGSVMAKDNLTVISKSSKSEQFLPTIWVDPDGCEHWVMDDGAEGYMTPNVTPDGIPVCRRKQDTCAVLASDQLFAVGKYNISGSGRAKLESFFRNADVTSFIIDGHTDSDAGDAYNMALSKRRANAVASVARSVGAKTETRWFGERVPIASNKTRAGKAKNRRVEIICVK